MTERKIIQLTEFNRNNISVKQIIMTVQIGRLADKYVCTGRLADKYVCTGRLAEI